MIVAQSQAEVSVAQQQTLVVGSTYDLFGDDRTGAIDYASPINPSPIAAWPDGVGKVGDGLAADGDGVDGIGLGGVGDGGGSGGLGPDGMGVGLLTIVTPPLPDGLHLLAVVGSDVAGNQAPPAAAAIVAVELAGVPAPPGPPRPTAFDGQYVTFTWTLSLDDEGQS